MNLSRGGTRTERIAEPVRSPAPPPRPEVADWRFPAAEETERKASAGGGIAAVWAHIL